MDSLCSKKSHRSKEMQILHPFQFPWRLHEMLETADSEGDASIVSWLDDEKSFRVHNQDAFVKRVMPRYFKQSKYKSFQRQLNFWGFERILDGPGKGGYAHQQFVRNQPSLCHRMKSEGTSNKTFKITKGQSISVSEETSQASSLTIACCLNQAQEPQEDESSPSRRSLEKDIPSWDQVQPLSLQPSSLQPPPLARLSIDLLFRYQDLKKEAIAAGGMDTSFGYQNLSSQDLKYVMAGYKLGKTLQK